MNLLLDTHAFLWYYAGSSELSETALRTLENEENTFFISIASLWEIAIKTSLGKLDLGADIEAFFGDIFEKGFNIIPIDPTHILQSTALPFHHRDPFDRLIIGQALAENMALVTKDSQFSLYVPTSGLQVIW